MSDLISRSALLDELFSYRNFLSCSSGKEDVNNLIDIVQSEPKL